VLIRLAVRAGVVTQVVEWGEGSIEAGKRRGRGRERQTDRQ
jgi:hypothetical protein